ncbi:hypothetical protein PoB_003227700 [Plakobranchus ocellatus]|uniref:Uncharacterized protein n=1 Tax=Plakobranchus ocellatus TaxID=259542 RepID=A0AAV4AFU6_9GAST|nr:hypothetical protein PoB_003227700 [Plakobranchus ocellatus]
MLTALNIGLSPEYFQALQCFSTKPQTVTTCDPATETNMRKVLSGRYQTGDIPPSQYMDKLCEAKLTQIDCELQGYSQSCSAGISELRTSVECASLPEPCRMGAQFVPVYKGICQKVTTPSPAGTVRPTVPPGGPGNVPTPSSGSNGNSNGNGGGGRGGGGNNSAASLPLGAGVASLCLLLLTTIAITGFPQQSDPRLSGPLTGQGAGGGARTYDRLVPADLRTDTLATVPPTPVIEHQDSFLTFCVPLSFTCKAQIRMIWYRKLDSTFCRRSKPKQSVLRKLYNKGMPVNKATKRDLVGLCKKLVIPEEFHLWCKFISASEAFKKPSLSLT